MYTAAFPDWKRIGKKLRDILRPPVDDGPSDEERLEQRTKDALSGFAYLDNFNEISTWIPQVDVIQQSNTPLLQRPLRKEHSREELATSVLICHDYNGPLIDCCTNDGCTEVI